MGLFQSFEINASGMTAQRFRTDIISQNVANATTTRTEDGTTYRRQVVTFAEKNTNSSFANVLSNAKNQYSATGVKVSSVTEDTDTDFTMKYDPSNPDADEDGYVTYPNVNIVTEMTDLIDASRSYEANATAFNSSKSMAIKGLEMGNS